jgi:hypothetical protein
MTCVREDIIKIYVILIMKMRTGFRWLRMGPVATSCGQRNVTSECRKGNEISSQRLQHYGVTALVTTVGYSVVWYTSTLSHEWLITFRKQLPSPTLPTSVILCEEIYMKGEKIVTLGLAMLHMIASTCVMRVVRFNV